MTPSASTTASRHSLSAGASAGAISPGTGGRRETRPSKFGYGATVIRERATHAAVPAPAEIAFGSFRLLPAQFLLLEGDKPVRLGSRALEILIVLLERPGELVSKQELMARVWPNIFVEPANLTVHISALRRTLRDGRDGNRFIINIPGRGYSFVASVAVSGPENRARTALADRAALPQSDH